MGSGHAFTVAYELQLTDAAFDTAEPWLTCTMCYRPAGDPDAGVREQQRTVDASSSAEQPNDDWTFAAAVIECDAARACAAPGAPRIADIAP